MTRIAFAVAAHPDDIEFMMAGTMALLGRRGYKLHYMTVANGSCGTMTLSRRRIAAVRRREAMAAAKALGAAYHPPLVDDFEVFYEPKLLARLAAVVREVAPAILLVPSPVDYMEDHVNTARLAVTAAFCRGVPNFRTAPPRPAVAGDVALYHAMPYGLCDTLRRPVRPEFYVNIAAVLGPSARHSPATGARRSGWTGARAWTATWTP